MAMLKKKKPTTTAKPTASLSAEAGRFFRELVEEYQIAGAGELSSRDAAGRRAFPERSGGSRVLSACSRGFNGAFGASEAKYV